MPGLVVQDDVVDDCCGGSTVMDRSGENGALPPEGAGAGDASGGAGVEPPFAAAPESLRNAFGLRRCAGVERVPLYRSRELTEATADDILLMRSLGIATVFDLRKQAERDLSPEPAIVCEAFDVRICTVDLQDDENRTRATMAPNVKAAYGKPGQRMIDLYGIMATHAGEVREIVRQILRQTSTAWSTARTAITAPASCAPASSASTASPAKRSSKTTLLPMYATRRSTDAI